MNDETVIAMQMKTGVEQSVYAVMILSMLKDKELLQGEQLSECIGASPTYFQKLLRKLVSTNIVTSTQGVKGGFKLNKRPEEITVYDIYLAIEGQQSLYSPSGIFGEMMHLDNKNKGCLLDEMMMEAEESWKNILKSETIASLHNRAKEAQFIISFEKLKTWVDDNKVI